jgi:hypothetical protein
MKYLRLYEEIDFKEFDETDYDGCDNYSEFEGHEDFCRFLLDKGVIDEFIKRYNDNPNNLSDLNIFLDKTSPERYIIVAFEWYFNGKGEVFWSGLHWDWLEYLGKNDCCS